MTSTGASRTPRAIPFGKYLLLERLHVGTAAEVFLAKTFGVEGFQKFVALKRIRSHLAHDVAHISGLTTELRLALTRVRPTTLGAAARIPGMTPAALTLLYRHARRAA